MDDETAEIELLEQNLNRTHQISQRMTFILSNYETRLVKLEKSILPLYNSTQIVNRRASNIDKALLKIDEVASSQEGVAAEEALILKGPQPGQFNVYKEALERLNANIVFKSSERDSLDTARLVETGAKKLTQLYTKLVAEASSGPITASSSDVPVVAFPAPLLNNLRPLVTFLRTLPLPSTHPSHLAAPAIFTTLKDAQRGYAGMRGDWSRKCLEGQGKRVVDRAETLDSVTAGRDFGSWVLSLVSTSEEEYDFLQELSPLSSPAQIATAYSILLNPILSLFNNTLSSLITLIKRSLHKNTFLALSVFSELQSLQSRWDKILSYRSSEGRQESNGLKDGLQSLRAVCLRSFPEFLADVKLAAAGKGGEGSTGPADFTISMVQYLEKITEVKDAVGSALLALGDGNWRMGDGIRVGQGSKLGEGDEDLIVEHFTYDVVTTTIASIASVSRTQRRPAIASIFSLNNACYLRARLLNSPSNDLIRTILAKPTADAIESNVRTAVAGYFDSNFMPLVQVLSDDPKEKSGTAAKAATKEKFTRFFDLLEETSERHKMARVLEDDDDEKESIADDAVKFVVPLLQRFTQKHRDKEFSKSKPFHGISRSFDDLIFLREPKDPQKYIKMTPEAVESQIRSFYH